MIQHAKATGNVGQEGPENTWRSRARGCIICPMEPYALSIVLPACNERPNLPQLLAEIDAVVANLPTCYLPAEIVIADDCSTDGSGTWLDEWARLRGRASRQVIHRAATGGKSAALWSAFEAIKGTVAVTLDADGQNDPADIPRLLERLADADLVCGIRVSRRESWRRRVASRIGNQVRNWLLNEAISDGGCALMAFRTDFLKQAQWFDGAHRFIPALLSMRGARVTQVPVNDRPRLGGTSHYDIARRGVETFRDGLFVRKLQRQTRLQRG